MQLRICGLCAGALVAGAAVLAGCGGHGGSSGTGTTSTGEFIQTNLTADTVAGQASVVDPKLTNPWGVAYSPSGPFWVANNGSGVVTTYNGSGQTQGIIVQIPSATGGQNGPVSGQVYNPTANFGIPGQGAATFIFCSEDGAISAWEGGASATIVANRNAQGAVYKGVAIAQNGSANFLYATNFHAGLIDEFDGNFNYIGSFTDGNIPSGFAPFGIRAFGGMLYVTYAKQLGPANHDDQAGPGNGFVDIFTPAGAVAKRLVSNGPLNSPWGLEIAPSGFGNIPGDLLVGNFGDGRINAFNLSTGNFDGPLNDGNNNPISIPGLWSLVVGNGSAAGSATTVYFTSGPNHEVDGLFGSLTPSGATNRKRVK